MTSNRLLNSRYCILPDAGASGTVYLAEDTHRFNTHCWIKQISLETRHASRSGIPPTQALVASRHPQIAVPSVAFEEFGSRYLIIEGAAGELLASRLAHTNSGKLAHGEALGIVQHILDILAVLHAQNPGAAFGLLSPETVVCLPDGTLQLLDWSAMPVVSADGQDAPPGVRGYLAPEQVSAGAHVDARADIYSLGVMLAQMVTGYNPASATSSFLIPAPRDLDPALPSSIAACISRATQLRPELRYASTAEMRQALPAFMPYQDPYRSAGAPTVALPGTVPLTSAPKPQRKRSGLWLALGAASAGLILCAGIVLSLFLGGVLGQHTGRLPGTAQPVYVATPTEGNPVVTETAELEPARSKITPSATSTNTPRATMTGTPATATPEPELTEPPRDPAETPLRIAYVRGSVGNTDIYVADRDGRNAICVACDRCDEAEPAWSPDGQYIIYQSNCEGSYDLWRVSSQGGAPIRLTQTGNVDEREPNWSRSGLIAYRASARNEDRNADGELWVMNADGTGNRSLGVRGRAPVWSPTGAQIVFMSERGGNWDIYRYDYERAQTYKLTNCSSNCRWPSWSPDGNHVAFHTTTGPRSVTAATIWTLAVSSGATTELVGGHGAGRPSWCGEGLVVFNSDRGIETVNERGQDRRVIISRSENWAPAWSP